MNIRKTLAGIALAGALTVGGGATAFAQTDTSSAPPFPNHPNVTCAEAVHRVADAQARLDHAKARVAELKARRDQLLANGHQQAADRLTDRIQKIESRIDKLQNRLSKIEVKVKDACGSDAQANS